MPSAPGVYGFVGKMGGRAGTAARKWLPDSLRAGSARDWQNYGAAAGRGAAVGGAIGGLTAIPDKDRSFLSGVVGGAIWGVAAGTGGSMAARRYGSGLLRASNHPTVKAKYANSGGKSHGQAMRQLGAVTRFAARGTGGAGLVVGAYGTGNWLIGNSRRRKRYTQYGNSAV